MHAMCIARSPCEPPPILSQIHENNRLIALITPAQHTAGSILAVVGYE